MTASPDTFGGVDSRSKVNNSTSSSAGNGGGNNDREVQNVEREVRMQISKMEENRPRLNYSQKTILAPMVRVGTLPMRLLALQFGADIVYTEELIDWKLLRSFRRENDVLGTVDYIDQTDGTIIFRTCAQERDRVVLQMGTADAERALKVARLVEHDVAGIDINMGCPKEFSVKGGMGVALMSNRNKAIEILRTLVNGVCVPITCKVRVLSDKNATVELCKAFAETGIAAIGVHGRTRDERPQHANRNDTIRAVAEALHIPVIANGGSKEIGCYKDIDKFRVDTGCSSVMLARAAEWNVSVFSPDGPLPLDDVIKQYLRLAVDFDNNGSNTKYCVQNMLRELQETPRGKTFLEAQTLEQICAVWDLADYCRSKQLEYKAAGLVGRREVCPQLLREEADANRSPAKRPRLAEDEEKDSNIVKMKVAFLRSVFPTDKDLPKTRLLAWARRQGLGMPNYNTIQEGKLFKSMLTLAGKQYTSSMWEKNKRWAEQAAALVCLCNCGQVDIATLHKDGSVL